MSEFKKDPAAVLRGANKRPVAVLKHHKAGFYAVEPEAFKAQTEELADRELLIRVRTQLADRSEVVKVVKVGIDERSPKAVR